MNSETKFFISVGVITLLILLGGIFLFSRNSPQETKIVDQKLLVKENSTKIASSSASATFVEFGDMQCPACALAHPMTKQAREEYAGKVNFVFRHFPLAQHKNALIGAMAIEAAGGQGKFWEMQDVMYERQSEWGEKENPMDIFLTYANELGLEESAFKQEIESKTYKDKIEGDIYDGTQIGVNSTPTFFINGVKYTGNYTYDDLKKALDVVMQEK